MLTRHFPRALKDASRCEDIKISDVGRQGGEIGRLGRLMPWVFTTDVGFCWFFGWFRTVSVVLEFLWSFFLRCDVVLVVLRCEQLAGEGQEEQHRTAENSRVPLLIRFLKCLEAVQIDGIL